jgi:hypothetical protein
MTDCTILANGISRKFLFTTAREPRRGARVGLLTALIGSLSLATLAVAADLDREIHFNIPRQPLAQALTDFARQSDVIVVVPSELTAGKLSKPVSATTTAEQALKQLLEGSKLGFTQKDGSIIVTRVVKISTLEVNMAPPSSASDTPRAADDTRQSADSATTESESKKALDEVVVTSQKRSERLQDVPIAVTAVQAEDLQRSGIADTMDLTAVVPGFMLQSFSTYFVPSIRGVSTTSTGLGEEENVATYVDGVYYAASFSLLYDFNNIERVEVLKGPQGTLFGRNATGGAVSIVTRTPSFAPSSDVSLSYGRFNQENLSYYGTTGLADTLAADIAVLQERRDGYIHDPVLNTEEGAKRTYAIRSKLLYKPVESFTATLGLDYSYDKDNSSFVSYHLDGNNQAKAIA